MQSPVSSESSAYDIYVNGTSSASPVYKYPTHSLDHTEAHFGAWEYFYNGTVCQPGTGGYMKITEKAPYDMNSLKAAIYHAEAGTGEIAKAISKCTFKPGERAFTKIISNCGRWRSSEKAFEVFQAMIEKRGVRPNTIVYTALVTACATAEDFEAMIDAFGQMKKAGRKDISCQPNEVTYNKLITASEENGYYAFAVTCFQDVVKRNLAVDRVAYYSALTSCVKSKSWKEAERVLFIMHEKGFAATLENYSAMIKHYGEKGEVQTAVNLFIKLQEMNQCVDKHCCHALMKAFELANNLEMVVELLNCMWEEDIPVKMDTYLSSLRVFALKGQWKPSLTILKRMVLDYDRIPKEAKSLILTAAKTSNKTEIVKQLEDLFNNEESDQDDYSSTASE
eukprot:g5008.t1